MEWTKKLLRKPPPAKSKEVNHAFLDRFTLAHFAIGFTYGSLGLGLTATITLALMWELIENPLKVNFPGIFPHATADTFQNIIGDTLAVILGWSAYQYACSYLWV